MYAQDPMLSPILVMPTRTSSQQQPSSLDSGRDYRGYLLLLALIYAQNQMLSQILVMPARTSPLPQLSSPDPCREDRGYGLFRASMCSQDPMLALFLVVPAHTYALLAEIYVDCGEAVPQQIDRNGSLGPIHPRLLKCESGYRRA